MRCSRALIVAITTDGTRTEMAGGHLEVDRDAEFNMKKKKKRRVSFQSSEMVAPSSVSCSTGIHSSMLDADYGRRHSLNQRCHYLVFYNEVKSLKEWLRGEEKSDLVTRPDRHGMSHDWHVCHHVCSYSIAYCLFCLYFCILLLSSFLK